jgi:type I restriction enzyme R subunit
MAGFDEDDFKGTLTDVSEEIKKLPQRHSELWDIFKTVQNKRDAEAFEQLLRDESIRAVFYEKVSAFSRNLKLALSTLEFHNTTSEKQIKQYKDDAAFFLSLRSSVAQRFSDVIKYSQYEAQIQKLIDKHIQMAEVKPITKLVNIFDKEKFQQEIDETVGNAARADRIASRTAKHLSEHMDEDPAFYKKFSQMLKETIQAYEENRIMEAEFLNVTSGIMETVLSHTDRDIPQELLGRDVARAFYGLTIEAFEDKLQDESLRKAIALNTALQIDNIIQNLAVYSGTPVIDWQEKSNITGKMVIEIGDYLIDEVRDKYSMDLSYDEIDAIAEKCIDVAKVRYK